MGPATNPIHASPDVVSTNVTLPQIERTLWIFRIKTRRNARIKPSNKIPTFPIGHSFTTTHNRGECQNLRKIAFHILIQVRSPAAYGTDENNYQT